MSAPLTPEEAFAELSTLTTLSLSEVHDFLSLPPDAQALCLQGYRHLEWTQSPSKLDAVLKVLGVLATIVGDVSGIAGAIGVVQTLKAAL